MAFNFYNPTRIHFGEGRVNELGSVLKKHGKRCMLVTTSNKEEVLKPLYDRVKGIITDAGVEVIHFDEAVPNPTVQSIEKAIGIVADRGIDVVVAVGGGSSIDTAKSIALFHDDLKPDWPTIFEKYTSPFEEYPLYGKSVMPLIAVPTTAGTGSELTQAMVISDLTTEEKICIFHDKVFPLEAIIDPELTYTLPRGITASTGFDAFSHSFESYMRNEASPYTMNLGLSSMKRIINTLPKLVNNLSDTDMRKEMCTAEMFSGISLANAAATVPHPLSEIVGGIAPRIAHGQALACIYPGYSHFQAGLTPEKAVDIIKLFDETFVADAGADVATTLQKHITDFIHSIGMKTSLTDLGVSEEEKEKMKVHFLLGVLPFGSKDQLTDIMISAF